MSCMCIHCQHTDHGSNPAVRRWHEKALGGLIGVCARCHRAQQVRRAAERELMEAS